MPAQKGDKYQDTVGQCFPDADWSVESALKTLFLSDRFLRVIWRNRVKGWYERRSQIRYLRMYKGFSMSFTCMRNRLRQMVKTMNGPIVAM